MAYKENTNSIKNSPTLHLLKRLKNNKISVYDPKAKLRKKIKNCTQVNNVNSLIRNSKIIILMTPWPEFRKINKILKIQKKRKIILIDPYRMIDLKIIKNKYIKYFTIGK